MAPSSRWTLRQGGPGMECFPSEKILALGYLNYYHFKKEKNDVSASKEAMKLFSWKCFCEGMVWRLCLCNCAIVILLLNALLNIIPQENRTV